LAPTSVTAFTASIADPPVVVTSSKITTDLPAMSAPSMRFLVPWSLTALRTKKPCR
jgi:hypothetical protein